MPLTDSHLWAFIALLSLATLAAFLIMHGRSLVAQANAWKILGQLNALEDEKVRGLVERIVRRENKGAPPPGQNQPRDPDEEARQALIRAFGGEQPVTMIEDQPDPQPGMEVVS